MPITEQELLAVATSLLSCTDEASHRSAVSRGYYAAYHQSVHWASKLATQGRAQNGSGVHKRHIDALINPTVSGADATKSKSIGYMLNNLKASRTKADYRLTDTVDLNEAKTAVANARIVTTKAV